MQISSPSDASAYGFEASSLDSSDSLNLAVGDSVLHSQYGRTHRHSNNFASRFQTAIVMPQRALTKYTSVYRLVVRLCVVPVTGCALQQSGIRCPRGRSTLPFFTDDYDHGFVNLRV